MFLNELNKKEAQSFLNLINLFANVDNVLAKEEKRLIEDYKSELNIEGQDLNNLSYGELIEELKKSSDRTKRIVYFELIGLALIDGEYGENEVDFLDKVATDLGITRAKRFAFANFFYKCKEIYDFTVVESEDKIKLLADEIEELIK